MGELSPHPDPLPGGERRMQERSLSPVGRGQYRHEGVMENKMREVVIVEAVRTPIGRRNGKLKDTHPVVLASLILKELVQRAGIKAEQVDDVVFGCVTQT